MNLRQRWSRLLHASKRRSNRCTKAKKGKNFHSTFTRRTLPIVLALAEIETVPRKKRGELYRQALITGLIMHQLDERIPAVLTALFTRELNADEVISQIARITGWKPSSGDLKEVLKALGGLQSTVSPEHSQDDGEQARLKAARVKMQNLI
ncbi:stable plasmid inheritance protein [Escherichia coli]|nr:stable plasmid inheritance protein [Escherichia coli]